MEIKAAITGAWNAFAIKITTFLPGLIGAVIIFIIGWIIAKLLQSGLVTFLRLVRFDKASEKAGIKAFLEKGNILKAPSEIVGRLVYWFVMILVLIASFEALGLPIVSKILDSIFSYLPNVVAAILVLSLGILLGSLLSAVVRTAVSNSGMEGSETYGKIALYAVASFSGAIAFVQLGIGEEIVTAAFIIVFGAVALALALAFGLGGRDVAADYLKKRFAEKKAKA